MKHPAIPKPDLQPISSTRDRRDERGVTIVLVAAAMVAVLAMAALSIDVVTLYLANTEAQRSADAAALAGVRILSLTGMTGDPQNGSGDWQTACNTASLVAQSVASQNVVGGIAPGTVTVTFQLPDGTTGDCSTGGTAFGVNPIVQVHVSRTNLPTFFSRIWGNRSAAVSATASAEAFNPSGSGVYAGSLVPVQPRCVKPWIIPNVAPQGGTFVQTADGSLSSSGIELNGINTGGEIGQQIVLQSACPTGSSVCTSLENKSVNTAGSYVPALIETTPAPVAVPSCALSDPYQEAIGGCDQATVYSCGSPNGITATADLSLNRSAESAAAASCLINFPNNDQLNNGTYPYEIEAGLGSPLAAVGVQPGKIITTSNSIVTVPIMHNTVPLGNSVQPPVTIVGFVQVFIQNIQPSGNLTGTILNVSGCSKNATQVGVSGSSPVPVRLIQPAP